MTQVPPAPFRFEHMQTHKYKDTHVCKHTHTHMHCGLPLPLLIYFFFFVLSHKDIIAMVTYGGSEVPHAETRVNRCPLCCSCPQAIEGNT